MRHLVIVGALIASACGSSPAAPTHAVVPARTSSLLVSGQSNALYVTPALRMIYPGPVVSVAEGGTPISAWASTGVLWTTLVAQIPDAPRAFVWWQGESDAMNPHYARDLTDVLARVRAQVHDPTLPILLVRVLDYPELAPVRAAETDYVARDAAAYLITVDDLPREAAGSYHLDPSAYATAAQRILAHLP